MGTPNPGTRGRGPLGSRSNRPVPDKGTLNRQRSKSAAELKADADRVAEARESKKSQYLMLARGASFAMQARSTKQSVMSWGHGVKQWLAEKAGQKPGSDKAERVQSFLGGKFLRMYLDGKVDDAVVAEAGVEIGESVEFKALTSGLGKHLQNLVTAQHAASMTPERMLSASNKHFDAKRKSKSGISFRNTLNTVIGGVTGVDIDSVRLEGESSSDAGTDRSYAVGITFYDVYDFENKRTGEYDAYRKKLAALLLADRFDDFEHAFGLETGALPGHRLTKLDDAAVFASFMYALEKKGWTPGGLPWHVTVPANVSLHFAPPRKHR